MNGGMSAIGTKRTVRLYPPFVRYWGLKSELSQIH